MQEKLVNIQTGPGKKVGIKVSEEKTSSKKKLLELEISDSGLSKTDEEIIHQR